MTWVRYLRFNSDWPFTGHHYQKSRQMLQAITQTVFRTLNSDISVSQLENGLQFFSCFCHFIKLNQLDALTCKEEQNTRVKLVQVLVQPHDAFY